MKQRPLWRRSNAAPYAIEVADVDQNGTPDIIIGHVESRPIVYFNDGDWLFTPVPFGDDEGVAYGARIAAVGGTLRNAPDRGQRTGI